MNIRQKGISLLELLVALTIGVLMLLVVAQLFASVKASYQVQENMGRLQESGRYAVDFISRELRQAGFRSEVWEIPQIGFPIMAGSVDGGGTSSDTLQFAYEDDENCLGAFNATGAGTPLGFFEKRHTFSVNNTRQLIYTCQYGPAGGALATQINNQVISENIENMQVLYGDDQTGNFSVNRWVSAGAWSNRANVVSVRVGLLAVTPNLIPTDNDAQSFNLVGVTIPAAGDRRIRKAYMATVNVRNLTL